MSDNEVMYFLCLEMNDVIFFDGVFVIIGDFFIFDYEVSNEEYL